MATSVTRRQFMTQAVGVAAVGSLVPTAIAHAALEMPLGFALHSLKALALKDLPGTLKQLAGIGYSAVDMVSFKGYGSDAPRDGFGPLTHLSATQVKKFIVDAGLTVRTCQFKFFEFTPDNISQTLDWARTLGLAHLAIGDDFERYVTRADWQRTFDDLNRYGEQVRRAGMQLGLHTQNQMWNRLGNDVVFDLLTREVKAENCAVLLDLGTTQAMHVDPAPIIRRHQGRIFALHLRDAKTPTSEGYLPALPLGDGDLNWKEILTAARDTHITENTVEMTRFPDQIDAYTRSLKYVRALTI